MMPFLVSLAICLVIIPVFRIVSARIGWVAQLRKDRWGTRRVPILGGAAMFIAFGGALIIGCKDLDHFDTAAMIFLVCAVGMFLLGLYDDGKKVNPPTKLMWQLLAATLIIFFTDTRIDIFPWPVANIILTYLWLIGITNAINLLDNMDGLAGGITIITSGMLGYFFWKEGYHNFLIISMALCGATLGFLVYNFPPAKIFMGNNGSLFLGFLLAALAISKRAQASNVFAALGVPILLLLFPIIDTIFVMITRMLRGQSPIKGGTDHTSHRLISFGLSERQTLLALYGVTLLSGIAAAALENMDYNLSLIFTPILLISLALFTAHLGKVRVVSESDDHLGTMARFVEAFTYKRRIFELLLDLVIIGFSYYLAFWTQYGLNMTTVSMSAFMQSWPIALGVSYLSFYIFGVYQGMWGYLGVGDLIHYAGAAFCSGGAAWILVKNIYPETVFTADIFIVFTLFLLIGLSGSRSSFQLLDQLYSGQKTMRRKTGVLIYGADEAGELVLTWLLRNAELGYKPVGFLDDKPQKWGKYIHNIKVIGGVEEIFRINKRLGLNGVIISNPLLLETAYGARLLEICQGIGIWIRVLRMELEDI
jgi:UDP-GlcNAc:undecaprenyl-phosphate GlcNAc-1-phosphate transferase